MTLSCRLADLAMTPWKMSGSWLEFLNFALFCELVIRFEERCLVVLSALFVCVLVRNS